MLIKLRYREWLDEDRCAPSGPLHYRIVQIPEGTDAKTLCARFDDTVHLKEFVIDPVGEQDQISDGYCVKGEVDKLEHRKTYAVFANMRSFNKQFLERFRKIKDGDEIIKS
ncbi:hypothetical protein KY335_05185 [Candidatus Woesearchaeota archaeon]|nr:hypothetical protein [Candidatus Woesearchaeota archaeon]